MDDVLVFQDREAFRLWLFENCSSSAGVWLVFGKAGGPKTVKAGEALEEALCFGWIDGQMQRIDDQTYKKYFSPRRAHSKWSEKNKALAERLEAQGRMTDFGRKKIEEAQKNGQWDAEARRGHGGTNRRAFRGAEGLRARVEQFSGHVPIGAKNVHTGVFRHQNSRGPGKAAGLDGGPAQSKSEAHVISRAAKRRGYFFSLHFRGEYDIMRLFAESDGTFPAVGRLIR